MEKGPARLDARQRRISEGIARADECFGRSIALRSGIARERRRKSRRIIAQEIQKLKFPKIDLDQLTKSDARKIQIARRLRQETTMPLRWIAERLQTGSVPYTAKLIRKARD